MAPGTGVRVQVEIFQKNTSILQREILKNAVREFLYSTNVILSEQKHYEPETYANNAVLCDHVEFLEVIPSHTDGPVR